MNTKKKDLCDDAAALLGAIEGGVNLDEAASRVVITRAQAQSFLQKAKLMFGSNDKSIDDQMYLLKELEANPLSGSSDVFKENAPTASDGEVWDAVRKRFEGGAHPNELRVMALSLGRMADALDERFKTSDYRPEFSWLSAAKQVERKSHRFAAVSSSISKYRQERDSIFDCELFGEPAWEMLLELFRQFSRKTIISSECLCIASRAPMTTALRYIDRLEDAGLVERIAGQGDGRVTLVRLSEKGLVSMGRVLEKGAPSSG